MLTLGEKIRKLEEAGIDTSKWKYQFELNGVRFNLSDDSEIKELVGDKFIFSPVDFNKEILVMNLRMSNSEGGYDKFVRDRLSYDYQMTWIEEMLVKMKKMPFQEKSVYKKFINKELVYELIRHRTKNISKKNFDFLAYDEYKNKVYELLCEFEGSDLLTLINRYKSIAIIDKDDKEVHPTIDYYQKKCPKWLDAYRGLNGFVCLCILAKYYNIGNLSHLYEQLDEFEDNNTLWKFIRIFLNMDLAEIYK